MKILELGTVKFWWGIKWWNIKEFLGGSSACKSDLSFK